MLTDGVRTNDEPSPPPTLLCVQEASQGTLAIAYCPGNAEGLLVLQIPAVYFTALPANSFTLVYHHNFFPVFFSFFRIMIVVLKATSIKAR